MAIIHITTVNMNDYCLYVHTVIQLQVQTYMLD